MSRIRGKNTTPERIVRSLLHRMGYRFRLHIRIPITAKDAEHNKLVGRKGTQRTQKRFPLRLERGEGQGEVSKKSTLRSLVVCPDIVLPKHKTVIFVHGCFWHRHRGCKNCTTPMHRREWWLAKLEGNATRDKLHQRALRKLGWRSIVIWECQTEKPKTLDRLSRKLSKLIG
jgi:DNA mismatch endonuclease (patch repair protein)